MHLTDYLERNANRLGSKPAVIFEDQQLGWAQLWTKVLAASSELSAALSPTQQDVVAILLPNSPDFIISYLAIVHAGHIAMPLDPAYKSLELDAILDQIATKFVVTNNEYRNKISAAAKKLKLVEDLAKTPANRPRLLRFDVDKQIASMTFTSGTTGQPKAVPNTHANHIWNIKACSQVWEWTEKDSLLIAVPLSHMLGIVMGLSGALYHGNTMYLQRWFDVREVMELLSSGKISFFSHAASAYTKIINQDNQKRDLSGVRLCVSGAAPLPPAIWHEFKKRYGIEITETYGTTETGRIAANTLGAKVLGSPGKVLPEVNLKLSKDGQVQIKSPGVFPGYYQNPAATKASLTPDGYWRTGDLAELKDGYVFLKGRQQERIRRYGYTISPRDVEWALHKLNGIDDIYVMGRQEPNDPNDELIYFVVGNLSEQRIRDFCKANLLFAWRPSRIIKLNQIPRTRSGKASMSALKDILDK